MAEPVLNVSISTHELKLLISDMIGECLLDYFQQADKTDTGFLTYAQVFEKFYLKPQRLIEWKQMGLINEYPVGKTVRFKMSELFKALETLAHQYKKDKQKEAQP